MKATARAADWGLPHKAVADPLAGTLAGASGRYEKRLADLEGVYADADAFSRLLAEDPGRLHYFVEDFRREERAGDLIFGTSVVMPGTVGREFHLTRGHVHQIPDRSEIYHCLSGRGVLLMERDGEVEAVELTPGSIAYVAGGWLHRSVNVGPDPLVTLFCYPADSGQDYGPIERANGMAKLVVEAGGGWELVENPTLCRRRVVSERRGSTMLFIGVTTGASLVMDVFSDWCEELGIDGATLRGVDLPPAAPAAAYREVVDRLIADERQRGALVTTHKLDLFAACRDRFREVDRFARLMQEVSSISRRGEGIVARARDPLTSERALRAFLPAGHWERTGAEALVLGAGGAATAIAWTLREGPPPAAPRRVTITDVDPGRLAAIERVLGASASRVPFRTVRVEADGGNDPLAAALPAGSLVINATGLGKDVPGSPLGDADAFPGAALAWELNYRGELDFIAQAERAGAVVEDGFRYFVHGWIEVIGDVFDVEVPSAGPAFDRLEGIARAALDARNDKDLSAATPREE